MSKKSKIVLTVVIVLAVIIIAAIGLIIVIGSNSNSSVLVNHDTVEKGSIQNTVNATGKVESKKENYIRSSANYEITKVNVNVGDKVKAGDVLCTIDDEKILESIAVSEANLESTNLSTYNNLQSAKRRYEELLATSNGEKTSGSTEVSIKNAKTALDNAQKDFDKAEKNYRELTGNSDYIKANNTLIAADASLKLAKKQYQEALKKYNKVDVYDIDGNLIFNFVSDATKSESSVLYHENCVQDARLAYEKNPTQALKQKYDDEFDALLESLTDDLRSLRISVETAQNSYDSSVIAVKDLEENLKDTYDKCEVALDSAKTAYDSAVKGLDTSLVEAEEAYELALKNAENVPAVLQLNQLKETLDDCTVKAESDGTITAVYAKEGKIASDTLFVVEDTSDLKITANVKQYDIKKIQVGQKVTITSDAIEDVEYEGVVSLVAPAATKDSQDGSFLIEVDVTSKDTELLIGMTAKLAIVTEEVTDIHAVRYDGIGTDDDGNSYVYLAVDDGMGTYKAKKVNVELGLEGMTEAEVISSDINDGDVVILDVDKCNDGDVVRLKPDKKSKAADTEEE